MTGGTNVGSSSRAATATAPSSSNNNNNNSSNNILSSKVSRALEVRSDTPAMKAALDALAHLPAVHQDDLFTVDSRSVRVAIEHDALQQALLLQDELRALLQTVSALRVGVAEMSSIARKVDEVIHSNVITASNGLPTNSSINNNITANDDTDGMGLDGTTTVTTTAPTSSASAVTSTDDPMSGSEQQEYNYNNNGLSIGSPMSSTSTSSDSAFKREQRLASVLSDCFMKRNMARKRVEAVHEFLERFDLSEEDARLLDHYAFEDVETSNVNGNAFLAALDRVRIIRTELSKAFGTLGDPGIYPPTKQQQQQSHRLSDTATTTLTSSSSLVLSDPTSNRLGTSSVLRMMETLAQRQERAYERLYHWLQRYLQLHENNNNNNNMNTTGTSSYLYDEDHLDECLSHPFVRKSLTTLRNVPAFYSHLLELIAQSRRTEETRRFLLALTSGYGGLPPIEMRAHDSVVYVGDMLAFCFRAFSVEADVAKGLLLYPSDGTIQEKEDEDEDDDDGEGKKEGKDGGDDNKGHGGDDGTGPDGRIVDDNDDDDDHGYMVEKPMSPKEMLHQSMGGLSRPLKSRILQVISNLARRPSGDDDDDNDDDRESDDGLMNDLDEEGASIRSHLSQLYEICGLLLFYTSALDKSLLKVTSMMMGGRGGGSTTTGHTDFSIDSGEKNPLVGALLDCLGEATNAYGVTLRVYGAMLEQLTVLTGDSEASLAHAMITRLVEVRKASPGFVRDVDCPEAYDQTLSLDWACGVLVDAALPACKTLDDTVSLKQSISVARQGGLTDTVVRSLETKLHEREGALVDVLVEKESSDVLDLCGLGTLVTAWDRFQRVYVEGMTMAAYPGLTPDEVESAMKEFYSSLYSPPIPSFENTIKDPTLRKLARTKIANTVCTRYATLYDAMSKPDKGGYDELSFLGHTPQQVATLFTV